MKKVVTVLMLLLVTLTLTGCNRNNEDEKPVIYATTYPVMYLIEMIAENTVYIERVPGSNVHSDAYDWSAKEIISMQNASFIFYVGANTDNYIPSNKENIFDDGDVTLIHIADYVDYASVCYETTHVHGDEEHLDDIVDTCNSAQLSPDPHFWLDPERMLVAAGMVRDLLVQEFPDFASQYNYNYADLQLELETLNEAYILMSEQATKPIITTNMLFNYWNEAFDIEILSLTADAHNDNTIPGDIIGFVNEAVTHDIGCILFETNANSPSGEAVLTGLQSVNPDAARRYIHGLGSLTKEELFDREDYLTLMYKNLEVLNEATK